MKKILVFALLLGTSLALSKDKSGTYQMGTYITSNLAADGTSTNDIHCGSGGWGGTTCAGGIRENQVTLYRVRVTNGIWILETNQQAVDETMRKMGETPVHFKAEKQNPLDFLKNGDRVLFRIETHKKIGGTETDVFIPFADNPNKEAKFVGSFRPDYIPTVPASTKPTDNVQAMCDAHRLSPDLERRLCSSPSLSSQVQAARMGENSETAKNSPAQAAALPNEGHLYSPLELLQMVQDGKASRCAVVTSPPGAEVFIDGNKAGVTPFALVLIRQDQPRIVKVQLQGFKTVETLVTPDGTTIPISLILEKE